MTHALLQQFTLTNFPYNITYSGTINYEHLFQLVLTLAERASYYKNYKLTEYFKAEQG